MAETNRTAPGPSLPRPKVTAPSVALARAREVERVRPT